MSEDPDYMRFSDLEEEEKYTWWERIRIKRYTKYIKKAIIKAMEDE